ncbi:MAG: N-acetylglutamate synthase [Candidatus Eremiobacteraeota bacterium]|nr:N-acetylglutamate synthase [Candidatus Eremiobacteraeota bacterium]
MSAMQAPAPAVPGFETYTANLGVRDETPDFLCVRAAVPKPVTVAMFTQSRFPGPSVVASRRHLAQGGIRGLVAISKNANVGNGPQGEADMHAVLDAVGAEIGVRADQLLVASTGVIGRRYPLQKMLGALAGIGSRFGPADFDAAARAIMTTDTRPKLVSAVVDGATLVGIAKGVGMIEPNMATLFSFWFTDALLEPDVQQSVFRSAMDRTFNCLSIDTDTSTSDTALLMSSGLQTGVSPERFAETLYRQAVRLTEMVAADGEGATKLIRVTVSGAADDRSAKLVAKSIVNSPLVKTAVHGADPNWGRVLMAAGKTRGVDLDLENLSVAFGNLTVYPAEAGVDLFALTDLLRRNSVDIAVRIGLGPGTSTVWGCDLSAEYVRINGAYST